MSNIGDEAQNNALKKYSLLFGKSELFKSAINDVASNDEKVK